MIKAFNLVLPLTMLLTLGAARAFVPSVGRQISTRATVAAAIFPKDDGKSSTKRYMSTTKYPVIAEESIMNPKGHGTSDKPVQQKLRWNCDYSTADRISNFNRHYAEYAGYWTTTSFLQSIKEGQEELPIKFYDSVTGKLLFTAPVGRTLEEFLKESQSHGWPSFRDEEVNWDYVRCLKDGECVSLTGTHLGHNIPDKKGNRYCINLVCVAGNPEE